MNNDLNELFLTLQDRKLNPRPGSYTNELLLTGEDEIVKKIGEEAIEVILAAKGQGDQRLIEESCRSYLSPPRPPRFPRSDLG